jgi:transposase InsO family protein
MAAQRVFTTHAGRYGQRRLRAQLRREGHAVGRQRLRGWLSRSGLRALCTRGGTRPPRTTQADPQAIAAANKLAIWPAATAPNQIWVGDITYLALATGQWPYLACWRDAFSRRVVGWHVSQSLHTDLILTAFNRAVAVCQPPPGLLVHADRGSQYTSDAFTTLLDRTQAIASLSRPGNPYDNALAESGWSTLKTELLPVEPALLTWKKLAWNWPNTSPTTTTPSACTRPWATAPRSKSNSTTSSTYLRACLEMVRA